MKYKASKVCIKCEDLKPLRCFYKNKHMADGHTNVCSVCKTDRKNILNRQPDELAVMMDRWAEQIGIGRRQYEIEQLPQHH